MAAQLQVLHQGINVLADTTAEFQCSFQGIQVLWCSVPSVQATGTLSDYLENALLDQLFNKTPLAEVTIWLAVSNTDPSESGLNISEPTEDTYERIETSSSSWTAASDGVLNNAADLTFAVVRDSWGTVTHLAGFDASSGGNMLFWGELGTARDMTYNDYLAFASGNITVRMY